MTKDTSKYGVSVTLLNQLVNLFSEHEKINEVILFGSRAIGNYSSGSDIDITIKGDSLNVNDILTLSTSIDDLFSPYQVDIIIYKNINENALIEHIEKYGIRLFKR